MGCPLFVDFDYYFFADVLCVAFRFEFATNEYINDMAIVTLETAATETGRKDFIAVGTTIDRGEDLAVKGAVRVFPIFLDVKREHIVLN